MWCRSSVRSVCYTLPQRYLLLSTQRCSSLSQVTRHVTPSLPPWCLVKNSRLADTARLEPFKRVLSDDQLPKSVDWRGTGADGPVKDQVSVKETSKVKSAISVWTGLALVRMGL